MGEIRIKRDVSGWDNRPAHQYINGEWIDIPTHHFINGRWQGELTSQSPLKFRADGEMLDWRVEGRTSRNLYSIEMKDDIWTSFRSGRIISRSDNVLQVLTTDSEQSSGVYTAASSVLRQLSTLSDTVSMSADICCDNPDAKISIGFETDGKLLYITTITSDFQHYEVTNFTFSKVQNFIVYCANKQAANIYIKNLMINLGSTALPYEPYGGVGDWDETEQKYVIPVRVEGENLFDGELPSVDTSLRYIDVEVGEGTFTLSSDVPKTPNGYATLFLLPSSGVSPSTELNGVWNGTPRTIETNRYIKIGYRILENINPADYTINLNKGSTAFPYEINIFTDHQLMDGDSIDFTTDQTVIPIATGNNTLTVDTAVQPSKVFVKFEG